jgi:conjugative relaxase-like TrwC/TraI family protein
VLTVAKVTQGSAAGYADYLQGKAKVAELGDYYLKDGERVEAPGRWAAGAGAVGADPELPVTAEQLRSLMAVRRPDTGEELRRAGGSGEAVAALDATFSAPKSVSAVWAVAGPELRREIERAHEQAIDRALAYSVERVAMIRQRIDQETVIHAKPTAVIATSWRHTTARAVENRLPDPQLHSHVLLHGAVRRDGQIMAIDSRSWLVHQREVGAAYRTELAHELNQAGFEIQRGTGRGQRYFEIAGVPAALLDRWSSRHHQVQAAIRERLADQETALQRIVSAGGQEGLDAAERLVLLRQTGQLAPREERWMSTSTRSPKTPATHRDLDEHWRATARAYQLDRPALDRLRDPRQPLGSVPRLTLLDGLTEFDATFPARDARAVALERSVGVPIAAALEPLRDMRRADEILLLADGTGTTRQHRSRERLTVSIAERLAATTVAPLAATVVARETERLDRELAERGGSLSDEQRRAIELGCSTQPFVVIEGHAGTGKSTTLTGIARAHQATGRQIIITSTAAVAAERLARELTAAGVNASAHSTVALRVAIIKGQIRIGPDTTIIHDEAALASTREQERLLAAVEESGARLIEIGDPRQSHPVGAGGLWPHLEHATRHAGAHVELTRNQRAQDPADRRDQALFRDGRHEHAMRGYAARDRIDITSEQSDAENHALDAAHADRTAGKTTIVIAQTSNEHLDELNARAQAIRLEHNQLGPDALPVPGRPYELHPGDEVQIRRTIPHPGHGHGHGQLRNGTTAQITTIDPDTNTIGLRLADGQEVELDGEQAARADLRLGYVQHPFPAQGQTTDTSHVIIAEHATQEGSYVALTRAREQTHIYAASPGDEPADGDRLQKLSERMSRTEPDLPSIHTPLAHESTIATELAHTTVDREHDNSAATQLTPEHSARSAPELLEQVTQVPAIGEDHAQEAAGAREHAPTELEPHPESSLQPEPTAPAAAGEAVDEQNGRAWPRSQHRDAGTRELTNEQTEGGHHYGWEP